MSDAILAILMLAGLMLSGGAVFIFRRGDAKRALLMIITALVMFGNVAIWLTPIPT